MATDEARDRPEGTQPTDGRDLELELARERLAFYESFDRLIQENIARSGDLLRQAVALRESAHREIAETRAAVESTLAAERQHHRALFAGLFDELTQLQQQAERLAGRVGDALAGFDAPASPPEEAAPTPAEAAPPVQPPEEAPPLPAAAEPPAAIEEPLAAEEAPVPAPVETAELVPPADAETVPAEVAEPPVEEAPEEAGPRSMTVLVHGVPRATAALSLQRHLSGLSHVDAVEAREYAEGILRLQVTVRGSLAVDDLRAWEGGAELEPVHVLNDVIEVRLPGATGF